MLVFGQPSFSIGRPAKRLRQPAGGGYDPEVDTLLARMTMAPAAARRQLISVLVADLKAAGIWARLDGFWMLAAHDAQAARLNWCSAAMDLVPMNGPAFTQDRGYGKGQRRRIVQDVRCGTCSALLFKCEGWPTGIEIRCRRCKTTTRFRPSEPTAGHASQQPSAPSAGSGHETCGSTYPTSTR
ncbi:Com family DNA-binding transcriptional regulator [Aureimonas frigidaquae]|uniref:Com family DNA-binding transcriptional regulator n=1 Tax=Aureimonas frigidaquae TaxID=424757 RepID=UPI000780A980|nr:Com family DNA-binding transcriptional regulator [Aureimonas frigidaquae]